MNWYSLLPLAGILTNLILGLLIYYRFREERTPTTTSYLFITIFLALWSLSDFITFVATDPWLAAKLNSIGIAGACYGVTFMLTFAIYFAETDWLNKRDWLKTILFVIPGAFTISAVVTPYMTSWSEPAYWGMWLIRGPIYPFLSIYAFLLSLFSVLVVLTVRFRKDIPEKRHQALMYSIAFSFPIVAGLITEIIAPFMNFKLIPLASIMTTISALIVGREILRHSFLGFTPSLVAEKVVGTLGDMLIVFNMDRKISFANRAAANILQYSPEEMIGLPVDRAIQDITKHIRINKLDISNTRKELISKEGERIPVSASGSHITDERSKTIGYVVTMRDLRKSDAIIERLERSQRELIRNTEELKRFNQATSGRINRLEELRNELKRLQGKA